MNRRELSLAFVFSILLGGVLIFIIAGSDGFSLKLPFINAGATISPQVRDASLSAIDTKPQPTQEPPQTLKVANPTATQVSLEEGAARGEDIEDVLLLYSGSNQTKFDMNFCRIAEYYGLLCRQEDLDLVNLTDDDFKDENGESFGLIGIHAQNLHQSSLLLASQEIEFLKSAIETGGSILLVSELTDSTFPAAMVMLTDGAVQAMSKPLDSQKNWIISSEAPEITWEFTGQTFTTNNIAHQRDYAIVFGNDAKVTTLMSSDDDEENEYSFFAKVDVGDGAVFVDGSEKSASIDEKPLREIYYDDEVFSRVIPIMMTMRYAMGAEVWQNTNNYATLIVDAAQLIDAVDTLNFEDLLIEMDNYEYHTTVAFPPVMWEESEPEVVGLFIKRFDRLSIVQLGNNHGEYEFYKYTVEPGETYRGKELPARPLADQEEDILEGLERLQRHRIRNQITDSRVMIFPWGISPEPTFELLKKYNYLATVNAQDVPLNADRPGDWDYGMYQANMDYANFPSVQRRLPGTLQPYALDLQPFILDLFIDKPALFYLHVGDFQESGIEAFNPAAIEMNRVSGDLEWQSLGSIIKHMYLQKVNDDGSIDLMMYTNHLEFENAYSIELDYHLKKIETLNVPIRSLMVNGHEFPYRLEAGELIVNVKVPAGEIVLIEILYGDG